jgi:hypothetical protein
VPPTGGLLLASSGVAVLDGLLDAAGGHGVQTLRGNLIQTAILSRIHIGYFCVLAPIRIGWRLGALRRAPL